MRRLGGGSCWLWWAVGWLMVSQLMMRGRARWPPDVEIPRGFDVSMACSCDAYSRHSLQFLAVCLNPAAIVTGALSSHAYASACSGGCQQGCCLFSSVPFNLPRPHPTCTTCTHLECRRVLWQGLAYHGTAPWCPKLAVCGWAYLAAPAGNGAGRGARHALHSDAPASYLAPRLEGKC